MDIVQPKDLEQDFRLAKRRQAELCRQKRIDLKRQPKQGWLPRMGLAPLQLCQLASRPLAGLPWELPGLFEASCGPGMAGRWGRSGTSLAGHPSGTSSPDGGPMGD